MRSFLPGGITHKWLLLRLWQTRTHCCGHIVAHNVSWARTRAGHKMNVVFPCCENWETFVADTKCFWTKSETFFVSRTQNLFPQQMFRERTNGETFVSATMCPRLPGPLFSLAFALRRHHMVSPLAYQLHLLLFGTGSARILFQGNTLWHVHGLSVYLNNPRQGRRLSRILIVKVRVPLWGHPLIWK